MKHLYTLATLIATTFSGHTAAATNISVHNAFSGNLIESYTDSESNLKFNFVYDDNNRLSSISSPLLGTDAVSFSYVPGVENSFNYDLSMTIDDGEEVINCYFKINDKGFVSTCLEQDYEIGYEDDADCSTWTFSYNDADQISKIERAGAYNYSVSVDYINGDIYESTVSDDYGCVTVTTPYYSDHLNPQPIVNPGGFMMFDDFYSMEVGELSFAYFAGILGKTTIHLPIGKNDNYGTSGLISWTIDASGYPSHYTFFKDDDIENDMDIAWQKTASVVTITDDSGKAEEEWYGIDGIKRSTPSNGIYIHRLPNGKIIRQYKKQSRDFEKFGEKFGSLKNLN